MGSEEITVVQLLTIILAVYGALLSSANLILQLRSKRWRVVVSYSIGGGPVAGECERWRDLIYLHIANFGERDVTIAGIMIRYERKWYMWISDFYIIRFTKRPYGRTIQFFSESFVEELKIPFELSPGHSTTIKLYKQKSSGTY